MKIYLYLLLKSNRSGFTLIELLMASMMTIFIVMAAGYGTMVMLRENSAASIASDTQYNTNRAADFIADEIKASTSVFDATSTTTGCNGTGYTPILGLTIPGQNAPVIYCIRDMSSVNDVWLGKNVIYRYGPPLDASGNYPSPSPLPSASPTQNTLVDLIATTPQSSTCQNAGWTKIPSGTPKGFFVCIEPTNRKMVELHLSVSALDSKAQTTTWMSPGPSSRLGDKAMYEVITQTFVRAPSDLAVSAPTPPTVTKPASGTSPVTFTFKRAGDVSKAITINFTLSGTAVNGTSYTAITSPGTVTMNANALSATKVVNVSSGATVNQTIILTITSGTGYAIGGTSSATVTIN